jgi:hypothetical protein
MPPIVPPHAEADRRPPPNGVKCGRAEPPAGQARPTSIDTNNGPLALRADIARWVNEGGAWEEAAS